MKVQPVGDRLTTIVALITSAMVSVCIVLLTHQPEWVFYTTAPLMLVLRQQS